MLGSAGWKGWVEGVVAKVTSAMPEPTEAKKILPLGLMLFFILFDYTILRDTKVKGERYPRRSFALSLFFRQRNRNGRGASSCFTGRAVDQLWGRTLFRTVPHGLWDKIGGILSWITFAVEKG